MLSSKAVARKTASRKTSSSRKRKTGGDAYASIRVGLVLAVLAGINVYVFLLGDDTAFEKVLKPVVSSRQLKERKPNPADQSIRVKPRRPSKWVDGEANRRAMVDFQPDEATGGFRDRLAQGETFNHKGAEIVPLPHRTKGEIRPNESLGEVLMREGFGNQTYPVIRALSRVMDPKLVRSKERYEVTQGPDGVPVALDFHPTPIKTVRAFRKPDGKWGAEKKARKLELRVSEASGEVVSSLFLSVSQAGESPALVGMLVDLFAWDVNFYTDTHPGDRWKVVVEKEFLGGQFYRYGRVLAAEYKGRKGKHQAFYYEAPGQKRGRYFDAKGRSVQKTMLKTPLRFVRVSSKFNLRRFHPVLHKTRAHLGVDYAAPVGTPVWAAASGRVVTAGRRGGAGIAVILKHNNGYMSQYFHLNRVARGLKVGQYVTQKQIIGYVGQTGLATGPHLHFGVLRNGKHLDPLRLPPQRLAGVNDRMAFKHQVAPLIATLDNIKDNDQGRANRDTALARSKGAAGTDRL